MYYTKRKISISGRKKDVTTAVCVLEKCPNLVICAESEARQSIQVLIDNYSLKATILWDGNIVWSRKRIMKDLRSVMRQGMTALSDYLNQFFHLCCGSIAHYSKQGWINQYPDLASLKQFLLFNEMGQDALSYQPHWATDRIEIIKDIYDVLSIVSSP